MFASNKRFKVASTSSSGDLEDTSEYDESSHVVSNFFQFPVNKITTISMNNVCDRFFQSSKLLNYKLSQLNFSKPVEFVYNPTEYAFDVYKNYIKTYCNNYKSIMYLGMNPGPWGMSQTGVPFGEISAVKDFLKLDGNVLKPTKESPHRPVEGFNCTRSEISGKRFWSLIQELCGTPNNFFGSSFVHNYCPLQLITSSGKNITPTELKKNERDLLFEICDYSLIETVEIYKVTIIVCIGRFAEKRVKKAFQAAPSLKDSIKILTIPHPSPRAVGNTNWQSQTIQLMDTLELLPFYKN